jgi:hypothetical protein
MVFTQNGAKKPRQFLLFLDFSPDDSFLTTLVEQVKHQTYFYVGYFDNNFKLHYVITNLNGHPVINEVNFFSNDSLVIKENYDLRGQSLNCIANDYPPYTVVPIECKGGQFNNCQLDGFFIDYLDLVGKRFNFTYSTSADGNWGVVPVSGNLDNGTWNGVFGGVINRKYDLRFINFLKS